MTLPASGFLRWCAVASGLLAVQRASAQQGPTQSGPQPGSVTIPTEAGDVVLTPGATTTTPVYIPPPGYPAPGVDINPGLPSSSRPSNDTSRASDSFDFQSGGAGPNVVRGEKGGEGILSSGPRAMAVPPIHTVKRGDTLWDLCSQYFGNPYNWPRVWSYNPQIENPHWIYPGDQVRMRQGATARELAELNAGPGGGSPTSGLVDRRAPVVRGTVFLRTQGFLGDSKRDIWGEVVGAREDQMLLSEGNHVYVNVRPGVDVRPGQVLTVFRTKEQPDDVEGARRPPGEIVTVKGSVRVEQWDPKARVARGLVVESVDVIERGAKVGPVRRRLDVVPTRPNRAEVRARVLTSIYPHVYLGQNQVVFIDHGSEDGLEPGNRLLVLKKGDTWRQSLVLPTRMARERPIIDSSKQGQIEATELHGDDKKFPDEVIGELRVLSTERYSSLALVTSASREIVPGDRALARRGY